MQACRRRRVSLRRWCVLLQACNTKHSQRGSLLGNASSLLKCLCEHRGKRERVWLYSDMTSARKRKRGKVYWNSSSAISLFIFSTSFMCGVLRNMERLSRCPLIKSTTLYGKYLFMRSCVRVKWLWCFWTDWSSGYPSRADREIKTFWKCGLKVFAIRQLLCWWSAVSADFLSWKCVKHKTHKLILCWCSF